MRIRLDIENHVEVFAFLYLAVLHPSGAGFTVLAFCAVAQFVVGEHICLFITASSLAISFDATRLALTARMLEEGTLHSESIR